MIRHGADTWTTFEKLLGINKKNNEEVILDKI